MRGRSLALLFILASLAASLLAAAPAGAAVGDLSFQGCLSAEAVPGCTAVTEATIGTPRPIAVSPDGRSVYVATEGPDAFVHLTRAPDGTLDFDTCLTADDQPGAPPCTDVPNLTRGDLRSIAVSPDGRSVYAVGGEEAVSHFLRAPDLGRPAYAGCVSSDEAAPCDVFGGDALRGVAALAIDPNGGSVYAAGLRNTLVELDRTVTGGQIAFATCFADHPFAGCPQQVPDGALAEATSVAVSPDGKSLYVAGLWSVAWFERDALGELRYLGCFASDGGPQSCESVPASVLEGLTDVLVSPDGNSLYALSRERNAILRFIRSQGGLLQYAGCFASDDAAGCVDLPGTPLQEPRSLAISTDGRSIYVAAPGSEAIAHFQRGGGGELAYRGCVARATLPNAGCVVLPAGVMETPHDLAVSPDGGSLYVTGRDSGTVLSFSRSLRDDLPPIAPPNPPRPGARCAGKPATIVGTARKDTLRGTPRRDVIAGLGGADTIRGRGGNDLICGGAGKDAIFGGAGKDRILGGGGQDRCLDGPGRDKVAACERGRARRG